VSNKVENIGNINDFEKIVSSYLIEALTLTRDEIFSVVSQKVIDYYYEPVFDNDDPTQPVYYKRTGKLLEELSATNITKNGDAYEFTVGWPDDYLRFRYSGGFVITGSNGSYNKATGQKVLTWMNSESHGGTVDGEHRFWDEAISELNGKKGIIELFKSNCKKVGLPILN
jgi:hypothetical protein